MTDPQIEVFIRTDGRVDVHVEGVEGMECLAETAELVDRLGQVEERELAAEAYVDVAERTSARVRR
jgi:hypothetical protein